MTNESLQALEWFEKALPIYEQIGESKRAYLTRKNIERLRCMPG